MMVRRDVVSESRSHRWAVFFFGGIVGAEETRPRAPMWLVAQPGLIFVSSIRLSHPCHVAVGRESDLRLRSGRRRRRDKEADARGRGGSSQASIGFSPQDPGSRQNLPSTRWIHTFRSRTFLYLGSVSIFSISAHDSQSVSRGSRC